jgi:hypothetical protein
MLVVFNNSELDIIPLTQNLQGRWLYLKLSSSSPILLIRNPVIHYTVSFILILILVQFVTQFWSLTPFIHTVSGLVSVSGSPCGSCIVQNGTGAVFTSNIQFPLPVIILPLFHTYLLPLLWCEAGLISQHIITTLNCVALVIRSLNVLYKTLLNCDVIRCIWLESNRIIVFMSHLGYRTLH